MCCSLTRSTKWITMVVQSRQSASALGVLAGEDGMLVTWDERLARAAIRAGLAVVPPPT